MKLNASSQNHSVGNDQWHCIQIILETSHFPLMEQEHMWKKNEALNILES